MKDVKENTKKFNISKYSEYACILSVIFVVGFFTIINPRFLSTYGLKNIMLEMAPLMLMAGGISFVLFTGGIDLSTGAIASCACVLTGIYVKDVGNIIILYLFIFGIFIGLLNGIIVSQFKLPSFIVTLCTQNIWTCIALIKSGGGSSIVPMNKRHIISWATENVGIFPVMFIFSILCIIILYFIQRNTKFGKNIFALGANARSSRIAGVNTKLTQISAFIICGACSSLSGVLYAYKLKSSVPTVGDSLGLLAISAVALGGTSMAGGKGSVLRTFLGVMTVISIYSGMNMIGVHALWKDIVIGFILIIAVYINSDKTGKDIIVK